MREDKEALLAEERRLVRLRRIMDFTAVLLWQADLTLSQAQKLIADAKERALELFPDKPEGSTPLYSYTGENVSLTWSFGENSVSTTTLCVKTDNGLEPYLTV